MSKLDPSTTFALLSAKPDNDVEVDIVSLPAQAAASRPFRRSNYLKAPPKRGRWARDRLSQPWLRTSSRWRRSRHLLRSRPFSQAEP
jgi:hypothetical protein